MALAVLMALSFESSLVPRAGAADDVTIPKARLEELLRKEAELDKLKADLKAAPPAVAAPAGESVTARTPAAKTVPARVSPPLASLPPLGKDELVQALDLANYYGADPAAADLRYRKQLLRLQGEIAGFEKSFLSKDYKILLQTADRNIRVICQMVTPDKFNAAYAIKNGSEFVGMADGARETIARVGQTVVLKGRCRGLKDGVIQLSECRLETGK